MNLSARHRLKAAESAVERMAARAAPRVSGTMPGGTPYAASDPHLLLWAHVAEVDGFLTGHQLYGRHPLDHLEYGMSPISKRTSDYRS
jgi:uncharacterized protein (DUF2236 family)